MMRAPITALVVGLCAALALGACGDTVEPVVEQPELDIDTYRQTVDSVLGEGCGNPSGCHGSERRPLALYVRRANRADPADVFLDPPLTNAELLANFERASSFAIDRGAGIELLVKPLAPSAGGIRHLGGDQYASPDDRDYRVIEAWIAGESP